MAKAGPCHRACLTCSRLALRKGQPGGKGWHIDKAPVLQKQPSRRHERGDVVEGERAQVRTRGVGTVVCVGREQGDPACHARQAPDKTLAGGFIEPLHDLAGQRQIKGWVMQGSDFVEGNVSQGQARCQARTLQRLPEPQQRLLALIDDDQLDVQPTGQRGEVQAATVFFRQTGDQHTTHARQDLVDHAPLRQILVGGADAFASAKAIG